jgi:hypothetical protein
MDWEQSVKLYWDLFAIQGDGWGDVLGSGVGGRGSGVGGRVSVGRNPRSNNPAPRPLHSSPLHSSPLYSSPLTLPKSLPQIGAVDRNTGTAGNPSKCGRDQSKGWRECPRGRKSVTDLASSPAVGSVVAVARNVTLRVCLRGSRLGSE